MSTAINIGLDLGSLAWRAAHVSGDEVVMLPVAAQEDSLNDLLRCQPSSETALGVHFPSVKSLLGRSSSPLGSHETPEDVVARRLQALVQDVGRHAAGGPGQLVIAVPALYSSAQRTTLRDIALESGFADVHLLNDSMAGVICHTRFRTKDSSGTFLVYGMGYRGFEIGIIRLARGRYRAVAYDGGSWGGGARFDMIVMRGCLGALASQKMWSAARQMSAEMWMGFRQVAQNVKETLQSQDCVNLTLNLAASEDAAIDASSRASIALDRTDFEQCVTTAVSSSMEKVERLLEDADLQTSQIDEVLLLGGSTQIPCIQRLIAERLGQPVTVLPAESIAKGAASYAGQLRLVPVAETPFLPDETDDEVIQETPTQPVLKVEFTSEEESPDTSETAPLAGLGNPDRARPVRRSADTFELDLHFENGARTDAPVASAATTEGTGDVHASRERLFQHVRSLVDAGAIREARGLLEGFIQDAEIMLSNLSKSAPDGIAQDVQRDLDAGREAIRNGQFQRGVEYSHMALSKDNENPLVFQEMIALHSEAALAHSSIDGYKKAIEWLQCARSHDPTNTEIHDVIADRHFLHAQQLVETNDASGALQVLEECLYSNPMHEEAEKLKAELSSSVSPS